MTRLLLGDLYLDSEDWSAAIAQYQQALELTPNAVSAWSRLAYACSKAERWDDAIAANEQVLGLAPEDYVTLRNLVYIYHTRGDELMALTYLDRAIAVAPADEVAALRTLREQLARP
jgi:Flp pilus assembly protein TadD